jgi:hypothetical protein
VDIAARKHFGEFVTDQFADAELALRASCGLIAMLMMTCHLLLPSCAGISRSKNGAASLAYVPRISIKFAVFL